MFFDGKTAKLRLFMFILFMIVVIWRTFWTFLILVFWRQCNLTEFFKGQNLVNLHRFWWTIWFDEYFFDNFRTARFPLTVRQCTNVTSVELQPKPRMIWSSISTLNTNGQKMSLKHQNPNSTKSVKKCWFWRESQNSIEIFSI